MSVGPERYANNCNCAVGHQAHVFVEGPFETARRLVEHARLKQESVMCALGMSPLNGHCACLRLLAARALP